MNRSFCSFVFICTVAVRLVLHGGPVPASLSLPTKEPIHGYGLLDALPGIVFSEPVVIASPPGETNQLFVAERLGKIYAITNVAQPNKTLLLNLTERTRSIPGLEPGLLGLAFHPGFASNRFVFVYRTVLVSGEGFFNRLSRFELPKTGGLPVDPSAEQIILQQRDFAVHQHNAGDIHFGPDGYLYLSLGDQSPPPQDWAITRQPIDKNFFGAILRIDVDLRADNLEPNPHPGVFGHYRVPKDNPFIGITSYHGLTVDPNSVRTEIFALGFRNPWRFCFDPFTGEMYCGDVGEAACEEVNLVAKGQNYGWPYKEAAKETSLHAGRPPLFTAVEPAFAYRHVSGNYGGEAIIGGRIYVGRSIPALRGLYIFGDNVRGNIWALHRPENEELPFAEFLTGEPGISTFGIDPRDSELLLASLGSGKILKLVYRDPDTNSFPKKLSETGIFKDLPALAPAPGVVSYTINVPFWSDHAVKRRWFGIMHGGGQFGFDPTNEWSLPEGAFWVKHFEFGASRGFSDAPRRLETRVLVRDKSGVYGVTYKWNNTGTEAELLPPQGLDEEIELPQARNGRSTQTWHYPSRLECRICHNEKAGFVLGFNTAQLNCASPENNENQLVQMFRSGYLSEEPPDPSALPRLAPATNSLYSAEYKVRSYFEANCSSCHRPGSPIIARWDARFHTAIKDKGLLGYSVIPNSVDSSYLYARVAYPGQVHMPPISTSELDVESIKLLEEWISGFPTPQWISGEIGASIAPGNASVLSNTVTVAGYGPIESNQPASGQFVLRPLQSAGQIVARLTQRTLEHPSARAGIWFSNADKPNTAVLFAGVKGQQIFCRNAEKTESLKLLASSDLPVWLRITRSNGRASFWIRGQGDWQLLDPELTAPPADALIGFATTAEGGVAEEFARFEDVSFTSISIVNQTHGPILHPSVVRAFCEVKGDTGSVQKVQFYLDGRLLSEDATAPYNLEFTSPGPGKFSVFGRAVFSDGTVLDSDRIDYVINPPVAATWRRSSDDSTLGDWKSGYGQIAAFTSDFELSSSNLNLSIEGAVLRARPFDSGSGYALEMPSGSGVVTQMWEGTNILIRIESRDPLLHLVSLYFERLAGTEMMLVKDSYSGQALYVEELSAIEAPRYVKFLTHGAVEVSITSSTGATLSGVFVDPASEPAPAGVFEEIPSELLIPTRVPVTIKPESSDRIVETAFLMDGIPFATVSTAPFIATITNPPPGRHNLSAGLTDIYGQTKVIDGPEFTSRTPPANARFVGIDKQTKGNWIGRYGQSGYVVVGASSNLPATITLETENANVYRWPRDETNDIALLQIPDRATVATAGWTHPWELAFSIRPTDPRPYQMSLYFVDGPNAFRMQQVEAFDALNGSLLDRREARDFAAGQYFRWLVQGSIRVRLTATHATPFLSGVFLDPGGDEPEFVTIQQPRDGILLFSPGRESVILDLPAEAVSSVELYIDNEVLSEHFGSATQVDLPRVFSGEHWLTAAVRDRNGSRIISPPIRISGTVPEPSAEFLGVDSSTQGNWPGVYGRNGYLIAAESTNVSPLLRASIATSNLWMWASQTENVTALKRVAAEGRIAAAWFAIPPVPLTPSFSLSDGEYHQISLYLLDYDGAVRRMMVRVLDALTGVILDEQAGDNFGIGKFFRWKARGDLRFEVTCENTTPVLSGVFIDPLTGYADWLRYHFSERERSVLEVIGEGADPDNDQIANLVEYAIGTNPRRLSHLWHSKSDPQHNEIAFTVSLDRSATDVDVSVETSTDLRSWLATKDAGIPSEVRTTHAQRIVTYRAPATGSTPAFFRLKVQRQTL